MLRKKTNFVSIILMILIYGNSYAALDVENNAIAGGIAVIDLVVNDNKDKPQAFFGGKEVFVQQKDNKYQALVGLPLLTKVGTHSLTIVHNATSNIKFAVKPHTYRRQYITLKSNKTKSVTPNKNNIDTIIKQRKILTKARNVFSSDILVKENFNKPAYGVITGYFGAQRFYNNKAGRPHTGVDYAAKTGTKVLAPAAGYVVLTGEFFFNGKAIFLNHGMGMISAFIHLNDIYVESGDYIKAGDIIGAVGSTGRSTGPHLHWSVYLNGTVVNPNQLLQ